MSTKVGKVLRIGAHKAPCKDLLRQTLSIGVYQVDLFAVLVRVVVESRIMPDHRLDRLSPSGVNLFPPLVVASW